MALLEAVNKTVESLKHVSDNLNYIQSLGLYQSYVQGDPFVIGAYLMIFYSLLCWLVSLPTRNYSQVDRLWSIVPFVYSIHFALHFYLQHSKIDARLVTIAVLTTLWGLRLSFNFYRKGGYNMKNEDHRWPVLRTIINNVVLFEIFNITFIATYQNFLLYAITLPAYYAYLSSHIPWTWVDTVATLFFVIFLVIETVADQQQWNFQTQKYHKIEKKIKLEGEFALGFIYTGLFAYSRHPNFWSEMTMWWCIYLFSVSGFGWFNATIIGTVLLTLLFQGSTAFTESITASKYPKYKHYQSVTPRFFPSFSRYVPDNKKSA